MFRSCALGSEREAGGTVAMVAGGGELVRPAAKIELGLRGAGSSGPQNGLRQWRLPGRGRPPGVGCDTDPGP